MQNKNIPSTICIPIEPGQKAYSTVLIDNRPHVLVGRDNQKACYVPMAGLRRGKKKSSIVCPPICIVGMGATGPTSPCSGQTERLEGGNTAFPYSNQLVATGGTSPYTFSVIAGTLNAGLTLSSAGLISGTPVAPTGDYTFTVQAIDANGCIGTQVFVMNVTSPT